MAEYHKRKGLIWRDDHHSEAVEEVIKQGRDSAEGKDEQCHMIKCKMLGTKSEREDWQEYSVVLATILPDVEAKASRVRGGEFGGASISMSSCYFSVPFASTHGAQARERIFQGVQIAEIEWVYLIRLNNQKYVARDIWEFKDCQIISSKSDSTCAVSGFAFSFQKIDITQKQIDPQSGQVKGNFHVEYDALKGIVKT